MDPAIVSAMAAVLGSLAGGSATVAAGWVTQRTQGRRELIQADIRDREQLYSAFIGECSRVLIDALYHTFEEPQKLGKAYELLNRIRLLASDAVLAEAERVVRRMTEQYFEPNLSPQEIRALVKAEGSDPLRPFGEACRAELKAMRTQF
jgi:type VI protein secretion system component VasK